MKIAVICDILGKANNGTTIASLRFIDSMRQRGHEVRVVCPDADRAGQSGYYISPKYNFGIFQNYVEKNGVAPAKADSAILEAAIADVDLIHVMMPFSLGKAAARYAHAHNIPLTASFHCQAENVTGHIFLMNLPLANRVAYRIFYKRLYRWCDCIHYPTQFICDTFESIVGPTPHEIISNGVGSNFVPRSTPRPAEFEGKYIVLFTGRYSREKSHKILIEAASRSEYRDKLQLIFAGAGPLDDALRHQAKKCGIPMPIMQFFSQDNLVDVVNWADLYVHPAEIESEAISCLEAIACGCVPLIADSPRSATRYFALSEKNLFRCNDPVDLAKKMDWWLSHPEEKEACAKEYLGYARQFDFTQCMDRMEQMLLETLEKKRHEG